MGMYSVHAWKCHNSYDICMLVFYVTMVFRWPQPCVSAEKQHWLHQCQHCPGTTGQPPLHTHTGLYYWSFLPLYVYHASCLMNSFSDLGCKVDGQTPVVPVQPLCVNSAHQKSSGIDQYQNIFPLSKICILLVFLTGFGYILLGFLTLNLCRNNVTVGGNKMRYW